MDILQHRLDVVWDVYIAESVKPSTRQKRGHGQWRKVSPSSPVPSVWEGFSRNDAKEIEKCKVESTCRENVVSSSDDIYLANLAPCKQEEADTRLFLHSADCVKQGHCLHFQGHCLSSMPSQSVIHFLSFQEGAN